ncbi:hypothetical protein B0G62_101592 [Paraburkholderia eburnea]|uniref:Uncharacterized protein n=1 Tax=Paraburkholderia eburnea TaxID=1189126 RepID=A0A2S4MNG8_9BURK|nr:hypothetical protein B0G62_101592 [Paraburkholderia eburnea]PRZ27322.1 hypothetical protein BX588_101591 [Paraburkholderia eburnea]
MRLIRKTSLPARTFCKAEPLTHGRIANRAEKANLRCRCCARKLHRDFIVCGASRNGRGFESATGFVVANEEHLAFRRLLSAFAVRVRSIVQASTEITAPRPWEGLYLDPVVDVQCDRLDLRTRLESCIKATVRTLIAPRRDLSLDSLPQRHVVDIVAYEGSTPILDLPYAMLEVNGLLRQIAEKHLRCATLFFHGFS